MNRCMYSISVRRKPEAISVWPRAAMNRCMNRWRYSISVWRNPEEISFWSMVCGRGGLRLCLLHDLTLSGRRSAEKQEHNQHHLCNKRAENKNRKVCHPDADWLTTCMYTSNAPDLVQTANQRFDLMLAVICLLCVILSHLSLSRSLSPRPLFLC